MAFDHLDMLSVLMHHGIKGQKWGKRNGPPYPLKPEVKKKAYSDKGGGGNKRKGQKSDGGQETTGIIEEVVFATALLSTIAISKLAEKHAEKRIIRNIEKESAKYSNDTDRAEDRKTEKIDPETGLYLKNGESTADEDMAKVNPNFENADAFKTNCTMCTAAMEMRQRGYDVAAGKTNGLQTWQGGLTEEEHGKWFTATDSNDGKRTEVNRKDFFSDAKKQGYTDDAINEMAKGGNGARGEVVVRFLAGGGHSMYYKVENGKVTIYDSQRNKKMSGSDLDELFEETYVTRVRRLDNLVPNVEQMKKDGAIV